MTRVKHWAGITLAILALFCYVAVSRPASESLYLIILAFALLVSFGILLDETKHYLDDRVAEKGAGKRVAKLKEKVNYRMLEMNSHSMPDSDTGSGKRPRTEFNETYYLIGMFVLLFIVSVFLTGLILPAAVVCLVWLVYMGFQIYSDYQVFANTPTQQVAAAPEGLVEVVVKLQPEGKILLSPISNTPCAFFSLELHRVVQQGKSSVDMVIADTQGYVPTIVGDGTGFLVMDYDGAEIDFYQGTYKIMLNNDLYDKNIIDKAAKFVQDVGASDGTAPVATDLKFTPGKKDVYMLEAYLPVNQDYFALGSVARSLDFGDGRIVKLFAADPKNRLLSLLPESKSRAMRGLLKTAGIYFATAMLMLALVYFAYSIHLW